MPNRTVSPKCAAICIDTRDGAGRRRLNGVAQYAQQHGWRMMLVRRRGEEAAREVTKLRPQGIIAYIAGQTLVDTAERLSVPLVDTAISEVDVPRTVSLDNREVGRLAAESLTRLGLKHFGYCGVCGKRASGERQSFLAEYLERSGFALAAFSQRVAEGEAQMKPLTSWLKSLPKPVGILTFDDKLGERVLTACRWSDLSVPDLVAVLGISPMQSGYRVGRSIGDSSRRSVDPSTKNSAPFACRRPAFFYPKAGKLWPTSPRPADFEPRPLSVGRSTGKTVVGRSNTATAFEVNDDPKVVSTRE